VLVRLPSAHPEPRRQSPREQRAARRRAEPRDVVPAVGAS
jgi:hypothetical protein